LIALLIAAMTVSLVEGPVTPKLEQGAEVHPGDTIETGEGGRVEITMPSGTLLRLGENSRITLRESVPQKVFSAKLLLGNIWAKVHTLLAGETFHVETENGVAGVRGTEFRVEVTPQQEDLVRVYEGVVQVDGKDGKWSHRVEPGNELRFHKDRAPMGPRAFDPVSEKGRFTDWVHSRREQRNPEREHRKREKLRERKRDH
jgi:ferric-dicitrate binding protein FerR (iron transport regulator)